jgi:hypothetical protein
MPEARILADVLYKWDPMRVKYWHRVWASEPIIYSFTGRIIGTNHFVIDQRPEFMRLEEQQEEAARRITEQRLFEFLLRPAISEGEVSQEVIPISIANLDRDEETGEYQFPNYDRVARFRSALESQSGIPAATLLKELEASLPVQRAGRDGHSPRRQQPPQTPLPAAPADGSRENATPAAPHRRHHRRRQIS